MRRLKEFLNEQHSMGISRKNAYHEAIRAFEKIAKTEFEDIYLDRKIINDVLAALSEPPMSRSDSTWNMYLVIYKRFAKWLANPDDMDCPKIWRKIKPKKIDWEEKLKNKWLTEQEFYDLLDVVDVLCVKALLCTTVAGALRIGEVENLAVGDVEVSGSGECRVTVSGKTGTRTFVMNQFAPVLIQWLNFHPLKHDKTAPLWTRRKIRCDRPINYGLQKSHIGNLLKKYCKLAGIKKPVSMHWLRHTKVTWSAKNRKLRINDKQANAMFGWSTNSNMYNRYTHLHGTDTEDTFRLLDGVEPTEKIEDRGKMLQRIKCFGCNELNLSGSLYCSKCGLPLTEEESKNYQLLQKIQKEVFEVYMEKIKAGMV